MYKLQVKNIDGTIDDFDLINAFKVIETGNRIALLSKGEYAGTEMLSKIYVTEFEEMNPGIYSLIGIKDEKVWGAATNAMKLIVQSTSDKFQEETKDIASKLSGEVDNLIKGSIVKSDSYSTRKAIGIDKEKLIPNEKGIIPLANQECFKREEVIETFNAFDAIPKENEDSLIETLDLPKLDEPGVDISKNVELPSQNANKFTSELSNPMLSSDTLEQSPVSVEDFSSLSSLSSKKEEEAVPVEQTTTTEKKFVDMELPEMPEMVANEPEKVNSSLFEETVIPQIQNPVIQEPTVLGPIDSNEDTTEVEKIQESTNKSNVPGIIDIDKLLDEKQNLIVHEVLDKLNEISAAVNSAFDDLKEVLGKNYDMDSKKVEPIQQQNVGDPLVGDALAYINSMQIPTENEAYRRAA